MDVYSVCVYMYVYLHIYIHMRMCMYIYIQTYTHAICTINQQQKNEVCPPLESENWSFRAFYASGLSA